MDRVQVFTADRIAVLPRGVEPLGQEKRANGGKRQAQAEQAKSGVSISVRKAGGTGELELLHADVAVMTVPLPLLQQGAVAFDPPLAEVRVCTVHGAY